MKAKTPKLTAAQSEIIEILKGNKYAVLVLYNAIRECNNVIRERAVLEIKSEGINKPINLGTFKSMLRNKFIVYTSLEFKLTKYKLNHDFFTPENEETGQPKQCEENVDVAIVEAPEITNENPLVVQTPIVENVVSESVEIVETPIVESATQKPTIKTTANKAYETAVSLLKRRIKFETMPVGKKATLAIQRNATNSLFTSSGSVVLVDEGIKIIIPFNNQELHLQEYAIKNKFSRIVSIELDRYEDRFEVTILGEKQTPNNVTNLLDQLEMEYDCAFEKDFEYIFPLGKDNISKELDALKKVLTEKVENEGEFLAGVFGFEIVSQEQDYMRYISQTYALQVLRNDQDAYILHTKNIYPDKTKDKYTLHSKIGKRNIAPRSINGLIKTHLVCYDTKKGTLPSFKIEKHYFRLKEEKPNVVIEDKKTKPIQPEPVKEEIVANFLSVELVNDKHLEGSYIIQNNLLPELYFCYEKSVFSDQIDATYYENREVAEHYLQEDLNFILFATLKGFLVGKIFQKYRGVFFDNESFTYNGKKLKKIYALIGGQKVWIGSTTKDVFRKMVRYNVILKKKIDSCIKYVFNEELNEYEFTEKRGGTRAGSGGKTKYKGQTKVFYMKIPASEIEAVRSLVENYLRPHESGR